MSFLSLDGKMQGVPARWGTRLVVFPRFLTLYRPKNATSRDPPPFEPGPPFRLGPLSPFCTSLGRGKGKGSRLERGSRLVVFLSCGLFGRGNTTSRVPPTSRDPLPFLIKGLDEGRGGCVRSFWAHTWLLSGRKGWKHRSPHELNYAVKYATARGRLATKTIQTTTNKWVLD